MARRRLNLDKQVHFTPFVIDGEPRDLSHLDAHVVEYVQAPTGDKPANSYVFHVTYSMHCFAKDYPHLSELDRERLMYRSDGESRPFCARRYALSKTLPGHIRDLPDAFMFHGGHQSYAVCPAQDESGQPVDYFISFVTYRYQKKLRLHVQSAYPLDKRLGKVKKVGFFSVAMALKRNRPLPKPGR